MHSSENFSFVDPQSTFPLSRAFHWQSYIEVEREMWALFPETDGKRVNFAQVGLTAKLFVESHSTGPISDDETYFLMPYEDRTLRPIRMKEVRRLTLEEFRWAHMTAIRLAGHLQGTSQVLEKIHMEICGDADN